MIGFIKGTIEEIETESLLLETGGVGFRVFVPVSTLDRGVKTGDRVKMYTYLHVKEDGMQLFGFFERDELEVFKMLISVSGIGPKGAMNILSELSVDELRFACLADDAAAIARAPGVGKKTAQKLILELRDKFDLEEAFEKKFAHEQGSGAAAGMEAVYGDAQADAVQALVALGYSNTEALQAVKKVEAVPGMDSEAILKAALKHFF